MWVPCNCIIMWRREKRKLVHLALLLQHCFMEGFDCFLLFTHLFCILLPVGVQNVLFITPLLPSHTLGEFLRIVSLL